MNRREFLKKATIAGVAGIGAVKSLGDFTVDAAAESRPELIIAQGGEPEQLLQTALATYGGLGKLIKPGSTVIIKANFSWNGPPKQACNTNPDLLAALVRVCKKAGAKRVKVVDLAIDYFDMTLENSGIQKAVKSAGGEIDALFKAATTEINSGVLKKFSVYEMALHADCLINVPILKHHYVTQMTNALKSYMGLSPDRFRMHMVGIDKAIVDLAKAIKPHLHIIDAYRILKDSGPQGPGTVATPKQLILTHDPVAADAYGASLLDLMPSYLKMAAEAGLGQMDLKKVNITKVQC
jgi:uncharacterized protein (DUF362 family)